MLWAQWMVPDPGPRHPLLGLSPSLSTDLKATQRGPNSKLQRRNKYGPGSQVTRHRTRTWGKSCQLPQPSRSEWPRRFMHTNSRSLPGCLVHGRADGLMFTTGSWAGATWKIGEQEAWGSPFRMVTERKLCHINVNQRACASEEALNSL